MNIFYKILCFLQSEMNRPKPFGLFHVCCLILVLIILMILYKRKKYYNEKQLKIVLGTYGIIALILEILKQLIWSFNYNNGVVIWKYTWYSFPFQLCTTPIYISIICLFLRKNKLRDKLLSYMAFITILGSISTMLIPNSCFVSDILVNIHTMYLHLGSFIVSIYLLMTKEIEIKKENLISSIQVFLIFVLIANILNIVIYNLNILNGETFNMFYISPYFISILPVFNIIQENVPYLLYLLIYIITIIIGGIIVYNISKLIKKVIYKSIKVLYT